MSEDAGMFRVKLRQDARCKMQDVVMENIKNLNGNGTHRTEGSALLLTSSRAAGARLPRPLSAACSVGLGDALSAGRPPLVGVR